jgi:MYXO-CTERM domain-containing protein
MSRLLSRLVPLSIGPIAVGLLLPSTALAQEDGVRAPTWDMSLEQLEAIGLGQYRGDAIPVPDDAPRERAPVRPAAAKQGTIFVNFDGADLSSGSDNSQTNSTSIGNLAGPFASYGEGSKRDAVMEAVRADWAAYNVIITSTRPQSGDYTMNMTGPTNPFGQGVLGIAPLDCFDAQTHNNITFAFHSANDQFSAAVTATTIGQEVAHSYGLEHVDEPGDVMNPYNAGGDASFRDACTAIVQQLSCPQQHEPHCGNGGYEQNAHQELLELFGTSVPDTAAPTVAITYPADGAVFEPGSDFVISVEASDDVSVASVQLYNNGAALESDASAPYGWPVSAIPEGTYELHVIARDTAENETMSNIVTITVGDAPPQGETEGGSSSDSDSDSDSDSNGSGAAADDDEDDEGDTDSLPGGNDRGEEGCGCSSTPRAFPVWMLLGALPLLRRRRRRC